MIVLKIKKILKSSLLFPLYKESKIKFIQKYPILYTRIVYKRFYKYSLNLEHPVKLSEKIQYLKLFVYPKNEKVILAADKFTLHEYLAENNLSKYSVPYIKIIDDINKLCLQELPDQFVLKKTNASGMNLIVKNKNKLDVVKTKDLLNKWMNTDFGALSTEHHYSAAIPQIICEPFLDLGDEYRFFMVSGEVAFIQVIKWDWTISQNGEKSEDNDVITGHKKHYRLFFDINLNLIRSDDGDYKKNISIPTYWEDLIHVSKIIGKDFPVVRVDFNDVNGAPKITELTFTPANGFLSILRDEEKLDSKLGEQLELSGIS
ncbi:ATP-grasp fold amidoligase family protein [Enterococcus sp. 22-H-5-01]|uniref:ATP-grasp fold amidoligase family protein n=1 Tax=Enterococcus sp. 22-H-5-01 TaxID=3418555 RepID=UPI003D0797F0